MLSRLGIRQKLSVLLVIPLAAVALVMIGFTAERIGDARSAGATASTALAARDIGALIQTLQQERLLSLGYLAAPSLQRSAVVAQSQTAVDDTARLGADPRTAQVIAQAGPALTALTGVRRGVVARAVSARAAFDAYHAADIALLDALRLGDPRGADAQGLGQLVALDALMRSNEEASGVGAIIVGSAVDPALNSTVLTAAVSGDAQNLGRFRQLVTPAQSSIVDLVENGQAAQKIHHMIGEISGAQRPTTAAAVSDALTAALTYTGLRRLAQDRIARDVANAAQSRANRAEAIAVGVAVGAATLFIGVVSLGVTVSRSISRPLRRLTRAAAVVADLARAELVRVADSDLPDPAPPQLASVDVDSQDEIAELATALNRVQATAALLLERQITTRSNIGIMFANIARRTQTLVGRQLQLIDELERNERDPELLQRLYRLDHVATRLRRSADSLLVVSGTIDQQLSDTPTRLADIVRSALAEIEGYRAVEFGQVCDVAIQADTVADLRLLIAELLENATNFSPPGTPVEVSAYLDHECHVLIVDHGLGMGPARLDEENRRLVERERLDVAPTRVLGLFVVGRLARRHGLGVRLEPSQGRGITATIRIPARLLSRPTGAAAPPPPVHPAPALGVVPPLAIEAMRRAEQTGPFPWLATRPGLVAIADSAADVPPEPAEEETWPGGLAISVEVTSGPPDWPPAPGPESDSVAHVDPATAPPPQRSAAAETDQASRVEPGAGQTRGGLSRRIPGTHLAEAVTGFGEMPITPRAERDPEAERAALNDYLSGFARATRDDDPEQPTQPTLAERHS